MAFKTSVDFDGDGTYDSKDFDISWAWLQTKLLLDQNLGGVNNGNFAAKVQEQYQANIDSAIAETPTEAVTVRQLPARPKEGADFSQLPQLKLARNWMFNAPSYDHNLLDSVTGEYTSGFRDETNTWTTSKTANAQLLSWGSTDTIDLHPGEDLPNQDNWTLYIKGKFRGGSIFNGWNTILKYRGATLTMVNANDTNIQGFKFNSYDGVFGYYQTGYKPVQLRNQEFELSIVRDGISVSIVFNGKVLPLFKPAEQPQPFDESQTSLLELPGNTYSRIDRCYISGNKFGMDKVIDAAGTYNGDIASYKAQHDLDLTNSFFAYKELFPDNYGNFLQIKDPTYGNSQKEQNRWWVTTPQQNDNEHPSKSTCLRVAKQWKKFWSLELPVIDCDSDWTIAFWFNVPTSGAFLKFQGNEGALEIGLNSTTNNGKFLKYTGTYTIDKPFSGFTARTGSNASGTTHYGWNHIVVTKTGSYIGAWTNGTANSWAGCSGIANNLTKVTPTLQNPGDGSKGAYFSHVRLLDYSVQLTPLGGKYTTTATPWLAELMKNVPTQAIVTEYTPGAHLQTY